MSMPFFLRKKTIIMFSLVISFLIISCTYWFVYHKQGDDTSLAQEENMESMNIDMVPNVQHDDHVLGNPQAPVVFFVYSDFSCPYCADYHQVLRTVMRTHGSEGKVAIVFRHMPMVQLHPEAPMYAHASECVAEFGGNALFWKFVDAIFNAHDPLKPLDVNALVALAQSVGVEHDVFVHCMQKNAYMESIEREYQEGIDSGATGSPYTIVQVAGERVPYQGAQSYKTIATMLQSILRKLELSENHGADTHANTSEFKNDFVYTNNFSDQASTTSSEASTSAVLIAPTATNTESILDGIVNE